MRVVLLAAALLLALPVLAAPSTSSGQAQPELVEKCPVCPQIAYQELSPEDRVQALAALATCRPTWERQFARYTELRVGCDAMARKAEADSKTRIEQESAMGQWFAEYQAGVAARDEYWRRYVGAQP